MRRRYWIAVGVVTAAIVAAGSALAATKLESPGARSQAVISDAAGRLHVTPGALSSALKKALDDQVDAAVAAGRLTKAQGDALKARIDAGPVPLVGPLGYGFRGRPFGFGLRHERPGMLAPGMFGAGLHAVTSYLGITPAQLRTALASGKSLAQIAKEQGKTADGLVAALLAGAKSRLDRVVTAKGLSSAREQAILQRLRTFFESLVNRTLPAPLLGMPQRPGLGFGWRSRRWDRPMPMHPLLRPPHPPSPQL
jgi:acetylglutamate kinase